MLCLSCGASCRLIGYIACWVIQCLPLRSKLALRLAHSCHECIFNLRGCPTEQLLSVFHWWRSKHVLNSDCFRSRLCGVFKDRPLPCRNRYCFVLSHVSNEESTCCIWHWFVVLLIMFKCFILSWLLYILLFLLLFIERLPFLISHYSLRANEVRVLSCQVEFFTMLRYHFVKCSTCLDSL